jgi:sulfite reductase alpha subunit
VGLDIDPNMIAHPRTNSYVKTDGWDEEAAKWFARKDDQATEAAE